MFFFIMGNEWDAVAFDRSTRKEDGEMEVQEIAGNVDRKRWPSLSDFLLAYLARLENWLAQAKADRAKIDGD